MKLALNRKDTKSFYAVVSGICGNLAAGWFVLALASIFDIFSLTRSVLFGIFFTWLAFLFERRSK